MRWRRPQGADPSRAQPCPNVAPSDRKSRPTARDAARRRGPPGTARRSTSWAPDFRRRSRSAAATPGFAAVPPDRTQNPCAARAPSTTPRPTAPPPDSRRGRGRDVGGDRPEAWIEASSSRRLARLGLSSSDDQSNRGRAMATRMGLVLRLVPSQATPQPLHHPGQAWCKKALLVKRDREKRRVCLRRWGITVSAQAPKSPLFFNLRHNATGSHFPQGRSVFQFS